MKFINPYHQNNLKCDVDDDDIEDWDESFLGHKEQE